MRHVRITVEFDGELSATQFAATDRGTSPTSRAHELYDAAFERACDAYQRFGDWARVSRDDHSLGMRADHPEFVGVQLLEDLEAGKRIPVAYPAGHVVLVGYDRARRERVQTVAVLAQLTMSEDAPPVAATLLAEAEATYSHRARGHDHQRAVLLAAIASEVAIKQRLRELARPRMADLLDIILSNPREVTQSPPQLLHKTCKAIVGISLQDDNKQLFKDIELRLFKLRNDVAHRGHLPSEAEGRAAVDIAQRLRAWLSSLNPSEDAVRAQ